MGSKKMPFTCSERELVVALVRERPIIEDKHTNAKNIELKKQAWDDLTTAFNSQPYVSQRNNIQLKRCWENIKTQRKKELSQEASSMKLTGGGPPDAGPSSSNHIIDIICPSINLIVPDVIDSNSIEISNDLRKKDYIADCTTDVDKESERGNKNIKEIVWLDQEKPTTNYEKENLPSPQKKTLKDFNTPTSSKN